MALKIGPQPEKSYANNVVDQGLDAFGRTLTVPEGGLRKNQNLNVQVNVKSSLSKQGDLRARLKVPNSYLNWTTQGFGGGFRNAGGIIFPYTPLINYEVKADYSSQHPVHSNFSQFFYQKSSVSGISLQAKFTVQNQKDADFYLATIILLKALTKMRVGKEPLRIGSPPPVCRLFAYGEFMLENVPVAVQSFRIELPDSVDYYTIDKNLPKTQTFDDGSEYNFDLYYGSNSVPTVSSLTINFVPMYSRREIQYYSVDKFISEPRGSDFRNKGYL